MIEYGKNIIIIIIIIKLSLFIKYIYKKLSSSHHLVSKKF